jgi:hypothetical protein
MHGPEPLTGGGDLNIVSTLLAAPLEAGKIYQGRLLRTDNTNGREMIVDKLELSPDNGGAILTEADDVNPGVVKTENATIYCEGTPASGAGGYGSTNTCIRRFLSPIENVGTGITITQSATDGDSFTINEAGVYTICYSDMNGSNAFLIGLSLNSTALSTVIEDPANDAYRIALHGHFTGSANGTARVFCTRYFSAGSVIRAHCGGGGGGNESSYQRTNFRISKIV